MLAIERVREGLRAMLDAGEGSTGRRESCGDGDSALGGPRARGVAVASESAEGEVTRGTAKCVDGGCGADRPSALELSGRAVRVELVDTLLVDGEGDRPRVGVGTGVASVDEGMDGGAVDWILVELRVVFTLLSRCCCSLCELVT